MSPIKLETVLLLMKCLAQLYVFHGRSYAFESTESSRRVFGVAELTESMTINSNERHTVSDRKKDAVKSSEKTRSNFTGVRTSFIRKPPRNKSLQTGFQNEKLKQELRKRQMIAPGYYQAECSEKKPCKEGTYCNVLYCEKCHKLNVACNANEQCCKGLVCTFGRCEKKSKGDPGTFCEKDTDCKDACCVLEPTINSHLPICKPMLDEYHQCASILYRKIWVGEKPDCGPCKSGFECVQKGIFGSHEVCMKPE